MSIHKTQNSKRYIMVFKENINTQIVKDLGGTVIREYENIPMVLFDEPAPFFMWNLSQHPEVEFVEEDLPIFLLKDFMDWGVRKINVASSWKKGWTGKKVKVAVADTGIGPHRDVPVTGGVSFVGYTKEYKDDNGHGTHVAGIVGARKNLRGCVGIAPDCELYALKVLDKSGSGHLSSLITSVDWAISNRMDILNLSVGLDQPSPSLEKILTKAAANGMLVVAAAGNSGDKNGYSDTVTYPAQYDSTIAVAAVTQKETRAPFSSTGPAVDIAAPGVGIFSTYPNHKYKRLSGTSMAAPHVTGVLAIMKEAFPNYSSSDLRAELFRSAKDLGPRNWFGHGLVQAPVRK